MTTNPARVAVCPAGVSRLPDRVEFLVHTVRWQPAPANDTIPHILVIGADNAAHLAPSLRSALSHSADTTNAFLALGIGAATGHIASICRTPHGAEPLHTLTLISASLPRVHLQSEIPNPKSQIPNPQSKIQNPKSEVWSRTIGALGEATYHRLASLHSCIIGCGRSGSLVATALTRLGIQHITLIDPDLVEPHNVGEMDAVTDADLGKPKVEAVAQQIHLVTLSPCHLVTIADSILSLSALVAVKCADLLICCVDNPTARLATAFLAALYLKPLLDIGTGIFREIPNPKSQIPNRTMGADVRLVLPNCCLLCFGGIAHLDRARTDLLSASPLHPFTPSPLHPFWHERAGSLRSLNTLAVGFALHLLEDFIGGRLKESVWLNVEFNDGGIPTLERRSPPPNPRCPVCALTGRGDEDIAALPSVLRADVKKTGRSGV